MIRRIFAFLLLSCFVLVSYAQDEKPTFVLVHGAFQDASGWMQTIESLTAAGYNAIAVELPGRGDDTSPMSELTLSSYRDAVLEALEAQSNPVILVGHSFGGIVISAVAEAAPDAVASLVYLAAYLPQSGDSLASLASQDHYSVLGQEGNFILADDFSYAAVNAEIFATAFCPDCNEEQAAIVASSQLNEPLAPLNEAVSLSAENFGTVHKVYILTAEDIVVSPQLQALMLSFSPVDRVFALNTGHAPYISQPEALASLLIESIP